MIALFFVCTEMTDNALFYKALHIFDRNRKIYTLFYICIMNPVLVKVSGEFWGKFGANCIRDPDAYMLATYWQHDGNILAIYRRFVGNMLAIAGFQIGKH